MPTPISDYFTLQAALLLLNMKGKIPESLLIETFNDASAQRWVTCPYCRSFAVGRKARRHAYMIAGKRYRGVTAACMKSGYHIPITRSSWKFTPSDASMTDVKNHARECGKKFIKFLNKKRHPSPDGVINSMLVKL